MTTTNVFGFSEHPHGIIHNARGSVLLSAKVEQDKVFLFRIEATEPGRGTGTATMERLQAFAASLGLPVMAFAVADYPKDQRRLNAWYESNGFRKQHASCGRPVYVWTPKIAVDKTPAAAQ